MRNTNKFNTACLCSILFFIIICNIAFAATESENPLFNEINQVYLGISVNDVDSAIAIALGLEKPKGAIVTEVIKDSPAEIAGINKDDVILEFDGNPIHSSKELRLFISQTKAGIQISFKIFRDKKEHLIKISVVSKYGNAILPYPTVINGVIASYDPYHSELGDANSNKPLDQLKLSNDGFSYDIGYNHGYSVWSKDQKEISRDELRSLRNKDIVRVLGEVIFLSKLGNYYEIYYIIEINGKKLATHDICFQPNTLPAVLENKNENLENNDNFKIITSGLTNGEKNILLNNVQEYLGSLNEINPLPNNFPSWFYNKYLRWTLHYHRAIKYLTNVDLNMAENELNLLFNEYPKELSNENINDIGGNIKSFEDMPDNTKNNIRLIRDSYLKDAKAKLIIIKSLQKQGIIKELYAKAVEQENTDKESAIKSYKELIEKYDGSEESAKAKSRIEELTKDVSAETVKRLLAEGDKLFDLKDYRNAAKSYRSALEINPTDITITEKMKKAEDLYNSGLVEKTQMDKEQKQNQIKMHIDLAKDAYNKKLYDKSAEEVQKAIALDSNNPDARLVKLDIETAIQVEKQKKKEAEALAHYQTGVGYLSRGRYSLAMDEFQTALNLNPSLTDAKTKIDQMLKTLTVEKIDSLGLAEVIYKPERISLYNATKYPVQYKGKIVKWSGVVKQKLNNKYIIQTNEDLMFSMTVINRNQATINFIDGSPITMIGRVDQLLTFENVLGVTKDILNIEALYVK